MRDYFARRWASGRGSVRGCVFFLSSRRRHTRLTCDWSSVVCSSDLRLMVLSVTLHMARVFYTGAYKPPREFNWVVGVLLLFLTLGLSFTGYLLPWDQLSIWAVTVGTNLAGYSPLVANQVRFVLLGGVEVGPNTLLRWYVLHVLGLPFVLVIFLAVHFWRIRKDGGISGPL